MKIKRYSTNFVMLHDDENGEWVRWEDVQAAIKTMMASTKETFEIEEK